MLSEKCHAKQRLSVLLFLWMNLFVVSITIYPNVWINYMLQVDSIFFCFFSIAMLCTNSDKSKKISKEKHQYAHTDTQTHTHISRFLFSLVIFVDLLKEVCYQFLLRLNACRNLVYVGKKFEWDMSKVRCVNTTCQYGLLLIFKLTHNALMQSRHICLQC